MIFGERTRQQKWAAVQKGALIIALGTGVAQWVSSGNITARAADSASAEKIVPAFVRQGNLIVLPEHSPLRARIVVQAVDARDMPRTLAVPASVEADPARTVNVLPPVTGRLLELKVRLGDYVAKGQVLALLSSGDFAQAYADLDKSRDALQLSKRALDRVRGVFDAGGSANKDVEQAESNYAQALDEYQRAEARFKALGGSAHGGDKARLLTLSAPISGYVTNLSAAPGAFVNDPTASLMTIANLDSVWFTAYVPENSAAFVARGQKAALTLPAYPGEAFHGTVTFVSAVLDPDTRSEKVRIAFDNRNGKFKPNMFANAIFTIPQARRVYVPGSALLMNNDSTTVLVEVSPWTFERRKIELGNEEADGAAVRKGLSPGDRIIVTGGVLLND